MTEKEGEKSNLGVGTDVNTIVQMVLRESYLETIEDMRAYANKVRELNSRKKALRSYVSALRGFKTDVLSTARERGVNLCRPGKNDQEGLAGIFDEYAHENVVGDVEFELCIPDRVPPVAVKSLDLLENEIARWEEHLSTLGDDAQLANIDLQNVLQKQQQLLQMLSNISKSLHETTMAVIRNIRG